MNDQLRALTAKFAADEIEIRILAWSKDRKRGRIVAYIEGNTVRNRLDSVLGVDGWNADYTAIPGKDAAVVCDLFIGKVGMKPDGSPVVTQIKKSNIGTGDDYKAACTDALKRAAMELGMGRYLADCPEIWVDLSEQGFIPDTERTRALVLHLLGYPKDEIEKVAAARKAAEKELRYLLHTFKQGSAPKKRRAGNADPEPQRHVNW